MKRNLVIMTMAMSLFFANSAFATDEAIMHQLKLMQDQINNLQGEVKNLKGELAGATARVEKAESRARLASVKNAEVAARAEAKKETDVKVSLSPGPKFETADGEYSFKLGGFAQADAAMFSDDRRDHPDGTNLRRARLSASGNITKDFKYKIENDFANNASALTDVYLEYVGLEPVSIMVGQFKEPFSLETLTSDLFTTFIERASPTAFSPDRKIGIAVSMPGDSAIGAYTLAGGFFGAGTGTASTDDEAKDFTARATLAPIAEKDKVLHFGVAGSHRIPDSAGDVMRFSSRAENSITSSLAVDTGNITRVEYVDLMGLEAAAVWGPASVQGEYMTTKVERQRGFADADLSGYYVEASYFLTGESRNYNVAQAKFDRVKPNNPLSFSKGGWGALQAMARLSNLDLNDAPVVNGGELTDWTVGFKWYPNANVAVLANYIKVDTDSRSVTANDDPDIWMLRTQFDF